MTTKTDSVVPNRTKFTLWPIRWRMVFLLVGLALLLWLGIKGWRIGRAAQSLLGQQTAVETLLENGITNINPDEAEAMVRTVRADFVVLRDETAFLMPLMPRLGWVPQFGPLLVAAPQLLEMGDAGTETAVYAIESTKPLLAVLQAESGDDQLPQLIQALSDASPGLAKAAVSLDRVAAAYGQIDNRDQFPDRLQPLFAQADEWLPIAQDSLAVVQILPEIMGVNGRRTYLLLAQNEDELRATGGFISGAGTLTIENGDIQSLNFQDASSFDLENLQTNSSLYAYPPQPLYELMQLDYLLLRDSNYWPDFPYSAQTAIELYERVEPFPPLDGVIAIDQEFMSLLVAATGPVQIPESNTTITAQNTVESFRNAFNIREGQTFRDWLQNRKAFLLTFATAILNKVQTDFGSVDPIVFVKNMHLALNGRHLQLYMVNAQETAVLDQLDWDGRLENLPGQDFLLVLDSNLGFNKSNMFIQRSIDYQVALNADGSSQATVVMNYSHTNPPGSSDGCTQKTSYYNTTTYQEIADRCYFNFLRVYVPEGAIMQGAAQHTIPAGILLNQSAWEKPANSFTEFANFTTFSNFFMVPRGESLTTQIMYSLPATVLQHQDGRSIYQLFLRKQAGTVAQPITVHLRLPDGSQVYDIESSSEAIIDYADAQVTISLNLAEDTLLTIAFEN